MIKPIVAVDIDGTIGDYHGHFTRFAEQWTGREMPDPRTINPGLPLYRHLGMSKSTYRACKLAYRQGGLKRSMPVDPWAPGVIRHWRHLGAEVWVCTTRPYLRLDNIDPDTRHWMRRNHIQHDGVLFGEHKYRELVRIVSPDRVLAVLDDLPALCRQAASLSLPAFLRDQPYNRVVHNPGIPWECPIEEFPRVKSLMEWSANVIVPAIKQFKEQHRGR